MAFYPFPEALQNLSKSTTVGNFGLWYNKYTPLSDAYKPADKNGKDTMPVEYYFSRYGEIKNKADGMLNQLLKQKHADMDDFCKGFLPDKYEGIVICATLTTPLITGVGESHPHEVSMVFDHNMGLPYIPASGIKGIVRFAHTLSLIPEACERDAINEKGYFNDEDNWTLIPMMFGTQRNRGKVVFLDVYPEKVPDLHIDIMNPHYGPYYSDDKKETPPADHHNPTPIKFLTVAKGTSFIFRAVAEKKENMPEKIKAAFTKALTEEGVGAKTAIGYGRFVITNIKDDDPVKPPVESPVAQEITVNRQTWESAYLYWSPGNQMLVATFENKKATIMGKGLVPEVLHKNLFEKRKTVMARVEVEAVGNSFKIIKIESVNVKV